MTAICSFIAIEFPESIHEKLDEVIQRLRQNNAGTVRWVPAQNIHLTLKFLGDISPANLDMLCKILAAESSRHAPFSVKVGGLGAFPSARRPRVIWIGITDTPALDALQHGVETETRRLGYAPEERPFSPHLTLGRVAHNVLPDQIRQLSDALIETKVGNLGTVEVQKLTVFRSDLQPGGAVYTPLFSCALAEG